MPTRDATAVINAPQNSPRCHRKTATREAARQQWVATPWRQKRKVLRHFRGLLAQEADSLLNCLALPQRTASSDSLAAELLPLADACKFLERETPRILQAKHYRSWLRWLGLPALTIEIARAPLGTILVIGPSNYPLFLPGVQTLQAIAAGNAVQWKPGRGGAAVGQRFVELLEQAGVPQGLVETLDESPAAAQKAIAAGVDKVVLTGSRDTGLAVQQQLAEFGIPAVMELSGFDPLVVLADADLQRVTRAIVFSLRLNGGATCIAPRRVYVHRGLYPQLQQALREAVTSLGTITTTSREAERGRVLIEEALASGGRLVAGADHELAADEFAPTVVADACAEIAEDLMLPIVLLHPFDQEAELEALPLAYDLGASVFGSPLAARRVAAKLRAGCITLNDVIAPTADARVPFAPGGASGFGVTRGAEGLLEFTRPRVTIQRHGRWLPHLEDPNANDSDILLAWLRCTHSSTWGQRMAAGKALLRAARR